MGWKSPAALAAELAAWILLAAGKKAWFLPAYRIWGGAFSGAIGRNIECP